MFEKLGIKLIVRLNHKKYEETIFENYGFKFLDIPFQDGTIPPEKIIDQFLEAAEAEPGAIAVHCKAGLGRTATLIGLYCIKHYGFPAAAFIGWSRICRPGSVLGPQQQYLNKVEEQYMEAGDSFAKRDELVSQLGDMSLYEKKDLAMSPHEKKIMESGDKGQADRLKEKKRLRES